MILTGVAVAAGFEELAMLVDFVEVNAALVDVDAGFAVVVAGFVVVVLVRRPRPSARVAEVLVARITFAWCRRAPSKETSGSVRYLSFAMGMSERAFLPCSARSTCMKGARQTRRRGGTCIKVSHSISRANASSSAHLSSFRS